MNRLVEVRQNAFKKNDLAARDLRQRFKQAGTFVVSLVSRPGSGKTAFLEKTLTLLRSDHRVAALVGDLATENDAVRLARSHVPVKQITTGTLYHLEASMVQRALEGGDFNELDYLFIELDGILSHHREKFKLPWRSATAGRVERVAWQHFRRENAIDRQFPIWEHGIRIARANNRAEGNRDIQTEPRGCTIISR